MALEEFDYGTESLQARKSIECFRLAIQAIYSVVCLFL